jgi:ribosomal-protein-alanine N-acetyltransferase
MGSGAREDEPVMTTATEVTVEVPKEADIPHVVELEVASFSDPWSAGAFSSALSEPVSYFRVARFAGRVAGYVVGWFVGDYGEVANLAVAPEMRRQGIASLLLDQAIADATRSGVAAIYLEVRDSNSGARSLYSSRGFAEVGRRRQYYRRPVEDAIVLRRLVGTVVDPDRRRNG